MPDPYDIPYGTDPANLTTRDHEFTQHERRQQFCARRNRALVLELENLLAEAELQAHRCQQVRQEGCADSLDRANLRQAVALAAALRAARDALGR